MMERITGEPARLWFGIIGFGQYHYTYASGREGDVGAGGFAPRKAAMSVYLPDGVGAYAAQLEHLGPHRTGVVCLHLGDLSKVDLTVLEEIVAESYRKVTSGTYVHRAAESSGGRPAPLSS